MNQNLSDQWDVPYQNGKEFSSITGPTLDKILSYFPQNVPKTCLDIGCGTGQTSRELWHRGFSVLSIDASALAINLAQKRTHLQPPELEYQQLDIETQQLKGTYSLIFCKLVYALIKDRSAFLEKIEQLLRPAGMFVIISPSQELVPEDKRAIATDHVQALSLLEKHFSLEAYQDINMMVYICKNKPQSDLK